jgi:predicted negative regulator of RcsB-dependent stress response
MNPTFAHPHWIVAGILLILGGFWLFRWARKNDTSAEIAAVEMDTALNKLRKKSSADEKATASPPAGKVAAARFRNSMAQFLGIVGMLMLIAGLVAIVFGVFYGPES